MFEQNVEESIRKLSNRRIDPKTGEYFNLEVAPPKTSIQAERMIICKEDEEEVVKMRYQEWSERITMLEDHFKNCLISVSTDRLMDQVFETIKETGLE